MASRLWGELVESCSTALSAPGAAWSPLPPVLAQHGCSAGGRPGRGGRWATPRDKAYVYLGSASAPPGGWIWGDMALLLGPKGFGQKLSCWPGQLRAPLHRALNLGRSHLKGYEAVYTVDAKENRFFLSLLSPMSLQHFPSLLSKTSAPSRGLSVMLSGPASSQPVGGRTGAWASPPEGSACWPLALTGWQWRAGLRSAGSGQWLL